MSSPTLPLSEPPALPDYGGQTFDLSLLNDAALSELRVMVLAELDSRLTIEQAPEEADQISLRFLRARDNRAPVAGAPAPDPGEVTYPAWVQPTGGHDAYPRDYRVSHGGKLWYSLLSANVWEPGTSGWREFFEQAEGEQPTYPEWVQPTGAHDAYRKGEFVTFEGEQYQSLRDGNVWSPAELPEAWELVSGEDSTDPETPPADGEYAEWVKPTGAHDAYNSGVRVWFEGVLYESVIDGNVYSPAEYPPGWLIVSDQPVAPEPDPEPEPDPDPEPEPEPDPDPDPEPEPEPPAPTYPEFKQPTGGHDAYKIGDRVMFEGKVYESKINGNVYSPTAYPAGWQLIA